MIKVGEVRHVGPSSRPTTTLVQTRQGESRDVYPGKTELKKRGSSRQKRGTWLVVLTRHSRGLFVTPVGLVENFVIENNMYKVHMSYYDTLRISVTLPMVLLRQLYR